jgi:uncharacterized integral membrane protein
MQTADSGPVSNWMIVEERDMLEAQEKVVIDKGMQTLWVIWAAMLGSLLIYIFICHQLGEGFMGTERTELPIGLLRKIFFGVTAAELIMTYYLRRFMLKGRPSVASINTARGSSTLDQPPFIGHYSSVVIISLAFSESIGIYGFVLFLLGDSFQTLYTFIAVSALAMLFYRPKREELNKLAMAYKERDELTSEM